MKLTIRGMILSALLLAPSVMFADTITLQPDPADLYDLDHAKYYTWGIHVEEDVSNIEITGAMLTFDNIRNWDDGDNDLWIHLLDWAKEGVKTYKDKGHGDAFAGLGLLLEHYEDLSDKPQDLVYKFDAKEIDVFNAYFQNDGVVGFGFDPDCHFYNDGVSLTVEYVEVPEPACLSLLAAGAACLLQRRRKA